jgi:ParB family chromosome partitioning protein
MATYQPGQLYQVPLAEMRPDPNQPRKYLDPEALDEMAASVGQMGIIQPVVCRQDAATGLVYVVAGERRCVAAMKTGLAAVPAIFVDGANAAEIALVENLLRQDLNPVEEAEALQRLMDARACTQDDLARMIGKSKATISVSLSLNNLPQAVRDECRQDPKVPKHVLAAIAQKKQERSMLTAFQQYKDRQAKAATAETDTAAPRKRSKAEALAQEIGLAASRLDKAEFPSFSAEEQTMLIESMNALKGILEAAIARAVKNRQKSQAAITLAMKGKRKAEAAVTRAMPGKKKRG